MKTSDEDLLQMEIYPNDDDDVQVTDENDHHDNVDHLLLQGGEGGGNEVVIDKLIQFEIPQDIEGKEKDPILKADDDSFC